MALAATFYTAHVDDAGSWTPLPAPDAPIPWKDGPLPTSGAQKAFASMADVAFDIPATSLAYIDVSGL